MYKIMVVDDEPDLVNGLAMSFQKEGYRVIKAYSGEEALKLVFEEYPHLILLDVAMPGMSGLEVCRTLRSKEVDTRIVMLSAKGEEIDKVVGLGIGIAIGHRNRSWAADTDFDSDSTCSRE